MVCEHVVFKKGVVHTIKHAQARPQYRDDCDFLREDRLYIVFEANGSLILRSLISLYPISNSRRRGSAYFTYRSSL